MWLEIVERFVVMLLIFAPLERLLPRRDIAVMRRQRGTDLLWVFVGVFPIMFLTAVIASVFQIALTPLLGGASSTIAGLPLVVQVIGVMVVADIGYYVMHRLHHTVPVLWKLHAVHHSIEEMDWMAAHRVHPIDQGLTRGVSMGVVYALGFPGLAIIVWSAIFGYHSMLKHSNIRVGFGPLRWLLVEPVFHHWHHANHEEAFDMNYAGQLPILDILFGTAIMDRPEGPRDYGTDTYVPEDFVGQLIHPMMPQKLQERSRGTGVPGLAAEPERRM